MKPYLLVIAVAFTACGKKNDVPILRHEVDTLAKYYRPKIAELETRVQAIMERGRTIPAEFPGVKEVGMQLQEARDTIGTLKGIVVGVPGQASPLDRQADAAAKDGKLGDLQKLLHDTEAMFDRGMTIIEDDLAAVEGWIAQYDRRLLAMAPAAAPGGEPPSGQPAGSQTPAAGQVPAVPPAPGAQPAAPVQPKH